MKKELYQDYFNEKHITVMGLGLLGRGVGDTAFLANNGAYVTVTDMKTEEELAQSLAILKDLPNISYTLGKHQAEDFEMKEFVLKAAGVPTDSPYIAHAKKHNVPVYMSAALVCDIAMKKLQGVTAVGITGTRGKSTVTQLVAYILKASGLRTHIGGNVRGVANLPLLDVLEDGDYLVLELDSWQLQGFNDMEISPHIAVFTSFLDDHMNYYKGSKDSYFNDKAAIYRHQNEYDALITSTQASEEIAAREKGKVHCTVPERQHFEMKLIGEHNQVAAQLAYEVASQCGVSDEEIRSAIANFPGIEGRLQDLGVVGDKHVRIFNDNNATTADATIAALEAITDVYHKKPILIMGGADKGLPMSELEQMILVVVKKTIFLAGTGTDKITLHKEYLFDTLLECLDKAMSLAEEGDIIVFSPGFASFSKEFANEYERNDTFISYVNTYKCKEA